MEEFDSSQIWEDERRRKELNKPGAMLSGSVERKQRVKLDDYTGYEELYNQFQSRENKKLGGQGTVEQRVDDYQGQGPGRIVMMDRTNAGDGIYFYPDDPDFDKKAVESIEGWGRVFNAPAELAPLLLPFAARSQPTNVVLQQGNRKLNVPITKGGQTFFQQKSLNKYKKQYSYVEDLLAGIDAKNVTSTPPPNVSGFQPSGTLQSKEGALQTRISQFQAGASSTTRNLNLTTDFAKTSILSAKPASDLGGIGDILEATYPKGKGSGLLKRELKTQIADVLIANQGRIGLKPSDPNFIDRQELFNIRDTEGLRYRVKKIDDFMKSVKAENPDSDLLNFQSFKSHISGAAKRKDATTAPEDVIRNLSNELLPDNPQLAEKLANQYLNTYRSGFARTKEASRRAGISVRQRSKEIETGKLTLAEDKYLPQVDAGHWVAAATGGSTDSHAARLEDAAANRAAGDDIAHNINPHAAKMAGIASTFPEAFVNFVDRQLGLNTIPNWKADFSAREIRTIESIPQHWSKEQVKEVFIQMKRDRKHDPKFNFGEGTKFTAEDLKPMDEIDPDNIYRRPTWRENVEGLEGK